MTSIDGATAHPAGLGAGAHCPSSGRSLHRAQRRGVPARALSRAVRSRSGGVPAVTAAHARAALAVTRGARVTSIDGATAHPAGLWAGAHCPSTGRSLHRAQRRGVPARALSRAVRSRSGGVPAVTAAHARAALAVTRGARVTSIDGATAHPAGLWAGAHCPSTGRSLHRAQRRGVPARALSRAVRSRSGGVPAVTAAHARAALAVTRGARVTSIDGATAHPAGQWAGAHCPSTGRSLHRAQRRGVPARALSRAVRSRSGGVPAVTAAHARAALAVTRGARVTSIDGAAAHPAGLGAGAHCPSTGRSLHRAQRRGVPARALSRAVRSRSGGVPAVTAAHARAALAVTRGARVTSIDGATAHPAGQWAGAHCPSTGRSLHRAQRRGVPARALSRAVRSRSGGVPAVTAAHARAALAVTRGARVTSIDGAAAHPAGQWAGAHCPSTGRSLHRAQRRGVPARALSRAVRSRSGGVPAVTAAHARAALAVTRGARVTSIDGATAHPAGQWAGARCPSSATSLHSAQRRAVPARALYRAVPSRTGGAPAVPAAHARAALAVTRGARVTSIDGATAHPAGLGAGARLPSSAPSLHSA